MTDTEPTPLIEPLARALYERTKPGLSWEKADARAKAMCREVATAILPTVRDLAERVGEIAREVKPTGPADIWHEGWKSGYLDGVTHPGNPRATTENPYEETP